MTTSIVILTYRRPELLAECLDSLEAAGAPERAETLVGINGGSVEDAAALRRVRPWARVHLLPRASRGQARNELVDRCRGDIVFFLDDDASLPADFFARLGSAAGRNPEARALGGPNLLPARATPFQRAVDFLLRSPLGAGPMRRRYAAVGSERPNPGWAFMLSGLAIRREVFSRGFRFPAACVSAEENLLLHDLCRAFGPGAYCPELFVYHHRRSGLRPFLSQVFVNGRGRGEITRLRPSSFHPAASAPLLLCFCALAAAFGGGILPAAALLAYSAGVAVETARMALAPEGRPRAAWMLPFLFPLAHVCYAAGLLRGLARGRRT